MPWLDDDNLTRTKRPAGRPLKNPFPSTEKEEDFAMRGRRMIELYFDDSNEKSKLNFVFSENKSISKTAFWSMIFIYYVEERHMKRNLQGFMAAILKHFGAKVVSDRTSMVKCIKMLYNLNINHRHTICSLPSEERSQRKHRSQYQYIVRLWEEKLSADV